MHCVSNTAKTSVSWGVTWNSQSRTLGPGGNQAFSSRQSDQRQRTPDGRTCFDGSLALRVDGGWQNGAAGDWQLLILECSIRLDTVEPCLEDTDALLLQVCTGYVQERWASVARSVADGSSRGDPANMALLPSTRVVTKAWTSVFAGLVSSDRGSSHSWRSQ